MMKSLEFTYDMCCMLNFSFNWGEKRFSTLFLLSLCNSEHMNTIGDLALFLYCLEKKLLRDYLIVSLRQVIRIISYYIFLLTLRHRKILREFL